VGETRLSLLKFVISCLLEEDTKKNQAKEKNGLYIDLTNHGMPADC